jgi:hypothetical protein
LRLFVLLELLFWPFSYDKNISTFNYRLLMA